MSSICVSFYNYLKNKHGIPDPSGILIDAVLGERSTANTIARMLRFGARGNGVTWGTGGGGWYSRLFTSWLVFVVAITIFLHVAQNWKSRHIYIYIDIFVEKSQNFVEKFSYIALFS